MWSAPIVFPFSLRNAATTACHLMALCMVQPPADSEFMGVIEHDTESLHKLLTEEPGSSSSSNSSRGSHHPSWECLMAETSEGHVESVSEGEATCRCFEQAPASKFIIMRVRPGWYAKGHKVYTGSG